MLQKAIMHSHTSPLKLKPSRWFTKEFYFYYICFCVVVPYMFKVTYNLSQLIATHPNYALYESYLSKGWIHGRQLDNSDAQYSQFRDNIPKLVPLVLIHLLINKANSHFHWISSKLRFSLLTSIIVLFLFHGASAFKYLFIITASFMIGYYLKGSRWNPIITWTFNLLILFINDYYDGYRFEHILGSQYSWLDRWEGFQARWHILFNFAILRLISFNLDYYWACRSHQKVYQMPHSDKERINTSLLIGDYNYLNFLAYVLYTPLLLCGPIITYNDFISQFRSPSHHLTRKYIITYAIRLVFIILVMELTLHYLYVVAISKAKAWEGASPIELSMIGYFNLVIIWMKLLIPWRFFRLWSLTDGIWVEENMIRCMSNNFSAQRFWKSWHRSFNRWTIRYIYIPLGGSQYFAFSMWIVFTFVALWHDIELKLLAWGWLICIFLLPEIIATRLFSEKKFGDKPYYRFVCGLGAVGNILMMMIANLVGFAVGLDGVKEMLVKIFGTTNGLFFLISVSICLFIAVQIMFEIRESEKRRGDPKWKM
ncbi:MBOAT, membrane-bound O-acyltransferase family-domain-containing protein [Cokeromyces recurvatus]|uniref:MBOAT, membrane-bound O-acyltransferase family-domain-containing protein n=1 Tax=Cokeromyces recurvatus TaxID=90255 RepID=UPI00221EC732|nr:MBOAT, membrane-bound O-acyltransferase family-domain-containing protein [Cokeromyces recurvatus]KAI7903280.1 MBOAT, membrane-bound O-acyltransferase family-domain-containing protein [Cokeromyces recurvatus]